LTQDIKYHVLRLPQERFGRSSKKVSDKEHRDSIASEEETLSLSVEERTRL